MMADVVAIAGDVDIAHARQFPAISADLTAIERHALVVTGSIARLHADIVAAAIFHAGKVAVAAVLDALRATLVPVRLEIREAALTAAATLHALRLTFTAAATFDRKLTAFAAAAALHPLCLAFTAKALHLHLATTAASATLYLLASASALLGLGLTTMSAAVLVGLRRSRDGYRKCRDTGCKDELPHHKSPIGFPARTTLLRGRSASRD
jgi:hypothetical protein